MGFKFRKSFRRSFKIAPGVRVNVGKKGLSSISLGKKGMSVNVGSKGVRSTVRIPGTKISVTSTSKAGHPHKNKNIANSSGQRKSGPSSTAGQSKQQQKPSFLRGFLAGGGLTFGICLFVSLLSGGMTKGLLLLSLIISGIVGLIAAASDAVSSNKDKPAVSEHSGRDRDTAEITQQSLPEQAKQGDTAAIAALINRHTQPKGITVRVNIARGSVLVIAEAEAVPEKSSLAPFIARGIKKLAISGVEQLVIQGRAAGSKMPAWREIFPLKEKSAIAQQPKKGTKPKKKEDPVFLVVNEITQFWQANIRNKAIVIGSALATALFSILLLGVGLQILFQPSPTAETAPPIQPSPVATTSPAPVKRNPGTGIGRMSIQAAFESAGFVFEQSSLASGEQRWMGKTANGLAVLELTGATENLTKITLLAGIPNDNDALREASVVYMLATLKHGANWEGDSAIEWLTGAAKKLNNTSKVSTVRGNQKITLSNLEGLGLVSLVIEGIPVVVAETPETATESASPETLSYEGDPYDEALAKAKGAFTLTQQAQNKGDWELAKALWEEATGLMKAVPPSSQNYETAKKKAEEYQRNVDVAAIKAGGDVKATDTPASPSPTTTPPVTSTTPARATKTGSCECPYDRDSAGRRCGGRSAYSKPGGSSPVCYR